MQRHHAPCIYDAAHQAGIFGKVNQLNMPLTNLRKRWNPQSRWNWPSTLC
jgi:hypothetical protein